MDGYLKYIDSYSPGVSHLSTAYQLMQVSFSIVDGGDGGNWREIQRLWRGIGGGMAGKFPDDVDNHGDNPACEKMYDIRLMTSINGISRTNRAKGQADTPAMNPRIFPRFPPYPRHLPPIPP